MTSIWHMNKIAAIKRHQAGTIQVRFWYIFYLILVRFSEYTEFWKSMLTLFNVITLTKPIWIFEFLYSDVKINAFYIWMSNYARQSLQYTWTLALLKWLTLNIATRIALGYDNFHGFEKDGGALDYSDVGDRIKMVTSSVFSSKSVTITMSPTHYSPSIRHQHQCRWRSFPPDRAKHQKPHFGIRIRFQIRVRLKKKVFELDFCDFLLIIDILKS